jgi:hypothetical protein
MSEEEIPTDAEAQDHGISGKVLKIQKVVGGYGRNLGLIKGDIIIGVDGEIFLGTKDDFRDQFDIDDEDEASEHQSRVLTIKRDEALFNLICKQMVKCKLEPIDNPYPQQSEHVQQTLAMAKDQELSEYLIYYDNKKNAEILLRSKSLLAMVIPPFWFLNQRMPEAMLASVLGGLAALAVHWILGAVYYTILCLYVGREQLNMAMGFMSYKRMIYMQSVAAINELQAQRVALTIDKDLYFKRPVEGLIQEKRRRKKKPKLNNTGVVLEQ